MNHKNLFTIFLLLLSIALNAQNLAFKVLALKGKVESRTHGHWSPLKVGSKINDNDEIRLHSNAYVGLIHVSGKPLEVAKPGHYKSTDLYTRIKSEKSLMDKYTSFILSKSEERGKNRMAATGAVHRGTQDILILLPTETVNVLVSRPTIYWRALKPSSSYLVTLLDMFGNQVLKTEVEAPEFTIDFENTELLQYSILAVKVSSTDHPDEESETFYVKRLSGDVKAKLLDNLQELKQALSTDSSLSLLLESAFYEENELPIEALMVIHASEGQGFDQEILKESCDHLLGRFGFNTATWNNQ